MKEEGPKEMTLDEWKAMQDKERAKVEFNIRKVNEGDDWNKGFVLHKSKAVVSLNHEFGSYFTLDFRDKFDGLDYVDHAVTLQALGRHIKIDPRLKPKQVITTMESPITSEFQREYCKTVFKRRSDIQVLHQFPV